jgi:hypothetical protein
MAGPGIMGVLGTVDKQHMQVLFLRLEKEGHGGSHRILKRYTQGFVFL